MVEKLGKMRKWQPRQTASRIRNLLNLAGNSLTSEFLIYKKRE
jgi:hypothetical protein